MAETKRHWGYQMTREEATEGIRRIREAWEGFARATVRTHPDNDDWCGIDFFGRVAEPCVDLSFCLLTTQDIDTLVEARRVSDDVTEAMNAIIAREQVARKEGEG
jgi:hypothetical protein